MMLTIHIRKNVFIQPGLPGGPMRIKTKLLMHFLQNGNSNICIPCTPSIPGKPCNFQRNIIGVLLAANLCIVGLQSKIMLKVKSEMFQRLTCTPWAPLRPSSPLSPLSPEQFGK